MNQILHIFRKDVKHTRWEILASLALLGLYTWHEPRTWSPLRAYAVLPPFLDFVWGILPGLVPISWCFLIVRAVQDESLVGDKQFWVTRPYDWYKLLAAKVLFILAFVNLPLFIADVILLKEGGFSPASHIAGLLSLQATMTVLVFLSVMAAASITPNIGQFLLLLLAVALCAIAIGSIQAAVPNASMPAGAFPGALIAILIFATLVFVVIWQYLRRAVWQSRAALIGALLAIVAILIATPYRFLIANEYPLPENGQPNLLQFSFDAEAPHSSKFKEPSPQQRDVDIQLPLRVSGFKDDLIVVRGIFVDIQTADGFRANSKWQPEFTLLQPQDDHWSANFSLDRKIYHRIEASPVNLHVSLALSSYKQENEQNVTALPNEFDIPEIGKCEIVRAETPALQCRAALKSPAFLATLEASNATCPPPPKSPPYEGQASASWGNWDDTLEADPGISPVAQFTVLFWKFAPNQTPESWGICPGTQMTFRAPDPAQKSRVELEIDGIRLADYLPRPVVASGEVVGGDVGISIFVPR